ncbi:hypothetical protein D6861_009805 [Macrococcoides caseolyticum]|uniref:Uncharacterized protein n=1 Tax=Macrococcus psychrotolerans TaxID=3039389 RepID=A0AAT9P6J0_9STAP|nr:MULTISPECIES: hypothetical protein [Macrococcus]MBQ5153687.1 hypothetical protein [Macrococcus caseolyticus]QYA32597.1 hypothetical protein KYI10_09665 [Macrococcus sp. 19Msa1099]QYA37408.1 hypothetical protein KYI07_09660 [Macrococcus caseolyticus]QYA76115.1 hypothetical protein KYI12_09655 [Macrococcus caseolyticus]RKO13132.1 hypothetical protein D6861_10415 [Macrococcus caseolyticus]
MLGRQFKKAMMIYLSISVLMFIVTIYLYLNEEMMQSISTGIFTILFMGLGLLYHRKYRHTHAKDETHQTDDIYHYQHFVINAEVSLTKQLLIYSVDGKFLGRLIALNKVSNAIFTIFISNQLAPGKYALVDASNNRLCTVKVKGCFQQTMTIRDEGNEIATIHQRLFQSAMRYVYEIKYKDTQDIIKTEALTNDLQHNDLFKISETQVPLEHSQRFQNLTMNTYEIFHRLDTDKGKIGLAMMCMHKINSRR